VGVQPRLVDPQVRVGQQAVPVEPLDVVALERRSVSPDRHAVLAHRLDQQGPGDRPAQRGGGEVGPPRAADVEGGARQACDGRRQSTGGATPAPYSNARPGTEAMSGSSYWRRSAV